MLTKFQRPVENEQYTTELEKHLTKMREVLNELTEGKVEADDIKKFIASLIKEQDENGFWSLIPSPEVDGDIRVLYWYTPTYIASAFMMAYYMQDKHEAETIPGFYKTFKKGLEASTGRNLTGHGFDDISGKLEALEIFIRAGVTNFIKSFPEISPKFTGIITDSIRWLRDSVSTGNTRGAWGEDYGDEMNRILKLLSLSEKITVFVYGTLMREKPNHNRFLSGAKFIGYAVAEGFELYNLGSYPGAVQSKDCKVKGELYEIDHDTLRRLDALEGEGTLYNRKYIKATLEDGNEYNSYIYVYNLEVSGRPKIDFQNQPWGNAEKIEYVWYATYGSNMLYERFLTYIKGGNCAFNGKYYSGCSDKSVPKDSRPIMIPYNMYFGNRESSWGVGGVSFLDLKSPGKTQGRMYLIKKQQFEDIHKQEGKSSNWYNKIEPLGEYEGVKIFTITNESKRESCTPSDGYIDVVKKGIKETYPHMSDLRIMEYLVECSKR